MESGKFLNIDFSSFLSCILKIWLLCKNPVNILKLDVMIESVSKHMSLQINYST